jgi:hypothetical protein
LSIFYLTLLLTITYFKSFKYDVVNETKLDSLINDTVQLVANYLEGEGDNKDTLPTLTPELCVRFEYNSIHVPIKKK